MKTIGRSLAFYLKYLEEMAVFYEGEDEDIKEALLSEVSNRGEFIEMIMQVGERADEQALALLTEARERIKKTFSSDIAYENIRNRGSWVKSLWLWPKGKNKHNPRQWQTGISFHENYQGRPCFIAWVWAKGGKRAEKNIAEILTNKKVAAISKDLDWESGSVAIGILPIDVQNVSNFEVNAEPFMAEVDRIFKEIASVLPKIFSM
jgi:hypothetical protein